MKKTKTLLVLSTAAIAAFSACALAACNGNGEPPAIPPVKIEQTDNAGIMPIITLSGNTGTHSAITSTVYTKMPTVVCGLNGKRMKWENISVVDEKDPQAVIDLETGTFKSNVAGKHTIKITATNPEDTVQVATETFEINVYRKLLDTTGNSNVTTVSETVGDVDDPVGNQSITLSNVHNSAGIFNIEPGKCYYAEVTFSGFYGGMNIAGDVLGLAHYAGLNATVGLSGQNRWLSMGLTNATQAERSAGEADVKNLISDVNGWNYGGGKCDIARHNKPDIFGKNGEGTDYTKPFTYAIARDGDMFYSFVNGIYIGGYCDSYYSSVNTMPGVFCRLTNSEKLYQVGYEGQKLTNIDYYGGEQAKTKIDGLIKGQLLDNWGASFCGTNGVTVGEYSEEKGYNYSVDAINKGTNDCTVTPNVVFSGNFAMEWDFKKESVGTGASVDAYVDLRNGKITTGNENSILEFGVTYKNSTKAGFVRFAGGSHISNAGTNNIDIDISALDDSEGLHFKLSRVVGGDGTVYNFEIISIKDGEKVTTTYEDKLQTSYNMAAFPVFKNRDVKGSYSNIKYYLPQVSE